MEKVVRIFRSFDEANRADREFYKSLTPEERMRILYELVWGDSSEAPQGFERVCRIAKLKQR